MGFCLGHEGAVVVWAHVLSATNKYELKEAVAMRAFVVPLVVTKSLCPEFLSLLKFAHLFYENPRSFSRKHPRNNAVAFIC